MNRTMDASLSGISDRILIEKRQEHQRVRADAGALADGLCLLHEAFGLDLIAHLEIQRGETIVAREEQLRLARRLGKGLRFPIALERSRGIAAVTLIDLSQHDQRNREMVEVAQPPVQVDRRLRGHHALRLAAIGQGTVRDGEVRIESRLEPEVTDLHRGLEAALARLDPPTGIERAVEHAEGRVAATRRAPPAAARP